MISELEESFTGYVELWEQVVIELVPRLLELHLGEMREVVVGLPDELLGREEGVDEQAAARDLPGYPLGPAVRALPAVELLTGNRLLLEPADPAPVVDLEELDAREQQLEGAASQVVGNEQVRVHHRQPVDERVDHLPLLREVLDVLALLDLLLEVERHRLGVQLPQEGQRLELLLYLRGPVLTHVLVDHQRDHGDFVGVVLRAAGLEGEADR